MADQKVSIIYTVQDKASKAIGGITSKMEGMGKRLLSVKGLMGGVMIGTIAKVGSSFIKAAGDLEQYTVSFEVMLGSASKAKALLEEINKVAIATPFEQTDIIKATQQLLAFGVANEDVIDTFKVLGDISQGNAVKLESLGLAYGKVQVMGKASMMEIKQVAQNGVPIFAALAKEMGVSQTEVAKLASEGKVSKEIFNAAMKGMTTEGGIFYQSMIKQSKTFGGVMSTASGNIGLFAQEMGQVLLPVAKAFAMAFNKVIGLFLNASKPIKLIISSLAAMLGIVLALIPVLGVFGVTAAVAFLPLTIAVGTIALITAGIMKFGFQIRMAGLHAKNTIISMQQGFIALARVVLSVYDKILEGIAFVMNKIPGMPKIELGTDDAIAGLDALNDKLEERRTTDEEFEEMQKEKDAEAAEEKEAQESALSAKEQAIKDKKDAENAKNHKAKLKQEKAAGDDFVSIAQAQGEKEKDIGKAVAQTGLEYVKKDLKGRILAKGAEVAAIGMGLLPPPTTLLGIAHLAASAALVAGGTSAIDSIKLAEGGIVGASQGGTLATIGEGGSDEAVIPLEDEEAMEKMGGLGGGGGTFILTMEDGTELAKGVYKKQQDLLKTGELT